MKNISRFLEDEVTGNRFVALFSATTETSDQAQKTGKIRESAQDVSVENPNMVKTTATLRLQDITMRGLQ